MASQKVPGHLSQQDRRVDVVDGTLGRGAAPRPGVLGGNVASWPLERKLIEAASRATEKLPREMQAQFAALFTPTSVAITGAVLVAWAGSHLVGVGEVVDLILLLITLGTVGWQAFQVGRDVGDFLRIAAGANTEDDLDRASVHLASAVATVGVTAFVAVIFKAGARLGGAARGAAAARMAYWGRSAEEWLVLLGKPKAPPLVLQRLETALGFLRERLPGRTAESIAGYLKGMDLSKPVRRVTLGRGQELVMYGDPARPGLFLTKPGTAMDRLGINPNGRQFLRFRLTKDVEALESRANPYPDTWTEPGKKYQAGGGGTQYILPDVKALIGSGTMVPVTAP